MPNSLCSSFDPEMKRWSSSQLSRAAEFTYATLALFALTQGPVTRLWSQSSKFIELLPSPTVSHVQFATYVVLQVPALALWIRRVEASWWRERANQFLFAFLGWLGLSVFWSTFARYSFPEFVSLLLTTSFGMYLATSYSLRQFWWLVATAMTLGVGLSWIAVMRLWDGAVDFQEDYWVGIYYNRNSLAPVSAVALIGTSALFITARRSDSRNWLARVFFATTLGVVVASIAAIELWQSDSRTSPLALLIALITCLLWLATRRLTRDSLGLIASHKSSTLLTLGLVALTIFAGIRFELGVGGLDESRTAFNQRGGIWSISWSGVLEKPLHGWGWMAAWHTPAFLISDDRPSWKAWGMEWSHNGYLDLLLGAGLPAALLFAFSVAAYSERISKASNFDGFSRLSIVTFVLVAATQESFFIGSHFLWALLVASLAIKA